MNQPFTKDTTRAERRDNAKRKDRRFRPAIAKAAYPYHRPAPGSYEEELLEMSYDEMQDRLLADSFTEED